ncbi:MAG: hypothetical protein WD071_02790 [Pseudohongiella sp.]|uniref:hypothetical protein n=1 Tax=Pseudohongiella sp. TaxID=1979412 RepID=UPI0034A056F7
MKKLFIGLLIVALLIGAGMFYVVSNLDSIVKRGIESAGTDALGTNVRVDSVAIDLSGGSATLSGFSIANPEGFSNQDMVRFDELTVAIDLGSLRSDIIRITSISSVNPYVLYELQGTQSNIDAVRARFPAQEPAPEATPGPQPVIGIDAVTISGIQGSLQSNLLSTPISVNLGDVNLPPVEGTPPELARQIARPLLSQLARNAAAAFAAVPASQLRDSAGQAVEELQEQLEQAEDAARSAADELRNRLGL